MYMYINCVIQNIVGFSVKFAKSPNYNLAKVSHYTSIDVLPGHVFDLASRHEDGGLEPVQGTPPLFGLDRINIHVHVLTYVSEVPDPKRYCSQFGEYCCD